MEVTIETIRTLRARTGAGVMDCKRALDRAQGNLEEAQEILKAEGLAAAAKKASRSTNEGLIETYVHSGGRIAAMIEVNCETDFVARTADFKELAHDLAMQIAAMSPLHVDASDLPQGDGDVPNQVCLMQQPFIRDPAITVRDRVNEAVAKLGENVRVRRFARFALGE